MDDKNKNANQLNIEVPEEIAGGVYSNFVIVGHNSSEFVLDFVQILPGLPQAKVRSRVIVAPQHAKRLLEGLVHTQKLALEQPKKRDVLLFGATAFLKREVKQKRKKKSSTFSNPLR